MFTSPFEKLLQALESPDATSAQLEKLRKYIKKTEGFSSIGGEYIDKRLEDNIHPERLLNLAYHFEKFEETQHLGSYLNKKVARYLIRENKGYDQFYYMYRHDTRKERNIMSDTMPELADIAFDDSFKICTTIAPNIGLDKYSLVLQMLEAANEFRSLLHLTISNKLEAEELHQVALRAIEKNSNVLFVLLESSTKLKILISENLDKNKDQDIFAVAIRNSNIPIENFESSFYFNNIIRSHSNNIPNTLAALYVRAEQEERWEYLLRLGANKNKKDLLRSIIKAKDQRLINKFFSLYKSYPEVKHLTPFM